jgi:hypothetical protein
MYALNTGAQIYTEKILMYLRAQIDLNTMIVEDMNTTLSPIDRSSRQKISKDQSFSTH